MTIPRLAIVACLLLLAACESQPFNFGWDESGPRRTGVWVKQGVSADQRQQDMRECMRTAQAQVERDRRIDQDTDDQGAGTTQGTEDLMQSMQGYGYEKRRDRLFADCMQEKGYRRE